MVSKDKTDQLQGQEGSGGIYVMRQRDWAKVRMATAKDELRERALRACSSDGEVYSNCK